MVGERNPNVRLIQIDASTFEEFEISEFEISRVDCNRNLILLMFQRNFDFYTNAIWCCPLKHVLQTTLYKGVFPSFAIQNLTWRL